MFFDFVVHPIHLRRFPLIAGDLHACSWLTLQSRRGLAPNTLEAYSRALERYLEFLKRSSMASATVTRGDLGLYLASFQAGLSNATVQQLLTVVRLFHGYLVEEGVRPNSPVGQTGGGRGMVARHHKLPWIPNEEDWQAILVAARAEPIRNRTMLAFAYDAGLRREIEIDGRQPKQRLAEIHAISMKRLSKVEPQTIRTTVPARSNRRPRPVEVRASTGQFTEVTQIATHSKRQFPTLSCLLGSPHQFGAIVADVVDLGIGLIHFHLFGLIGRQQIERQPFGLFPVQPAVVVALANSKAHGALAACPLWAIREVEHWHKISPFVHGVLSSRYASPTWRYLPHHEWTFLVAAKSHLPRWSSDLRRIGCEPQNRPGGGGPASSVSNAFALHFTKPLIFRSPRFARMPMLGLWRWVHVGLFRCGVVGLEVDSESM